MSFAESRTDPEVADEQIPIFEQPLIDRSSLNTSRYINHKIIRNNFASSYERRHLPSHEYSEFFDEIGDDFLTPEERAALEYKNSASAAAEPKMDMINPEFDPVGSINSSLYYEKLPADPEKIEQELIEQLTGKKQDKVPSAGSEESKEEREADRAIAAEQVTDSNFTLSNTEEYVSTTFLTNRPEVVEDTTKTGQDVPFSADAFFDGNDIIYIIKMRKGAFLYSDSIMFHPKGSVHLGSFNLPLPEKHEDISGSYSVYLNELSVKVPVLSARRGDHVTLLYQGCDELGICFPIQKYTVKIPHNLFAQERPSLPKTAKQPEAVNYDLIADRKKLEGDGIADLMLANPLAALPLFFLLGIGLTLTPCVLPMLPIFSAMIIGPSSKEPPHPDLQHKPTLKERLFGRRKFSRVLKQNLGYAVGLSVTCMIFGLLFSTMGASLHSVLQSPAALWILAVILIICALSCADIVEISLPSSLSARLQGLVSKIGTASFTGAMSLGAISAVIASPCTSAPLAGVLIYIMTTGDMFLGAISFLLTGLGMSFPLFIVGMFGSGILSGSEVLGRFLRRTLSVIMMFTAFYLVKHMLGSSALIILTLLVYVACVYVLYNICCLILRRRLPLNGVICLAVISLLPSYMASNSFEKTMSPAFRYENFTQAVDETALMKATADKYSFVVFTAEWCSNCKIMAKTVYSDDSFIAAAADVNKVLIDITNADDPRIKEILQKYAIAGVPCYITLDPEGNIIEKKLGTVSKHTVSESIHNMIRMNKGIH